MTPDELFKRMKHYALRIIRLVSSFPKGLPGEVMGRQLIKAGTSVPANYRSACVAISKASLIHKLGIVEEEADESVFWIDLSPDAGLTKRHLVEDLLREGKEILAIVVQSRKTAKFGRKR